MRRRLSDTTARRLALSAALAFLVVLIGRVLISLAQGSEAGQGVSVLGEAALYVVVGSLPVAGVVIVRQQPRNRIGWLLIGIAGVWGLGLATDDYARYGLVVDPGSLPWPEIAAALNAVTWAPGLGLMGTFLILLFPDGRLPSPRWRPVAWLCGITLVGLTVTAELTPGKLGVGPAPQLENPWGLQFAAPVLGPLLAVLLLTLPVCVVLCAAGLILRFRRSSGVERLQLKWLATAAGVVALMFLGSFVSSALYQALSAVGGDPGWMTLLDSLTLLSFALIPAAVGTAMLRHRLYDIDVVINRTLVYAALTVTLAGVYVGSVLVLQRVVHPLTRDSALAVACSTLAVAAAFRPARTRIQAAVDRRFYRTRYDAGRTLDAFASRLRHELDLEAVGADLRTTVTDTVQPAHLSLWLRP